jgi:major membrane immunogen (membrane-anchored lipoprotein)
MKKIIVLACILLCACGKNTEALLGTWKVQSKFYRATYNIVEVDNELKAEVVYYNDDTTVLRQNEETPFYLFHNLKFQDDHSIDAISGATKTKEQPVFLKLKHKDTLEVTTYISNQPLKEIWIKTQK